MTDFSRFNQKLMYDTVARRSLRIRLYDMWETIENEHLYVDCGARKFNDSDIYDRYYDAKEVDFFIHAVNMCYILYGKSGYKYLQDKIGDMPLWEYRYLNILGKLDVIGIVLSDEEKEKLKYVLKAYEGNVFHLDACGIAALLLRVRGYVELEMGKKRRGFSSLLLSKRFDGIIQKISKEVNEKKLCDIDISRFLSGDEEFELFEKEIGYIEELFKDQSFPQIHIKNMTLDELEVIDDNRYKPHTFTGIEGIKEEDWLLLRCANLQARGKITAVDADKCIFMFDEMVVRNLPFIEYCTKEEMDIIEKQNLFYLLRRYRFNYRSVAFAEFIFCEIDGDRKIKANVRKKCDTAGSEFLLYTKIEKDAVTVPHVSSLTEEDYDEGVVAIMLEVNK